jgi:metallophosphoesterase (TIGR03767 family)
VNARPVVHWSYDRPPNPSSGRVLTPKPRRVGASWQAYPVEWARPGRLLGAERWLKPCEQFAQLRGIPPGFGDARRVALSRRDVLLAGLAVATTVGIAGVFGEDPAAAAPADTTLEATLARGVPGPRGYASLAQRGGESHLVRTDLGIAASASREDNRRAMVAFAHLTDVHVVDAQSPMRAEFLDRFRDVGTGHTRDGYRPHEMLSAQVADAMVRAVNEKGRAPVTGVPLSFALQTGDGSDNSQFNEIRWNIAILDGGLVRADSGDPGLWEGVAATGPGLWDPHYWHPDGSPAATAADLPRAAYGFPVVPGLLDAARRPFVAQGLGIPWFTAFGNHDQLVSGTAPATAARQAVALGDRKLFSPPPGFTPHQLHRAVGLDYPALLRSLRSTPFVRRVTPDPERRLLSRSQLVEQHFHTTGSPMGHGFTARNRADGTAYYTFDHGRIRFIVLDSVNPGQGPRGSLDTTQFGWLRAQLASSTDRVVVLASHHTSTTMNSPSVNGQQRVYGDQVLALALATPNVVAWVNGHKHRNQIWAHPRKDGGGMWEINTASHIDWPMQSRLLEIVDNRDGTLSIFCTMLDHTGRASYDRRTATSVELASLARELAANDWQQLGEARGGSLADRNVELLVAAPHGASA